VGVHLVWLAAPGGRLPAACGAVLDVDGTGTGQLTPVCAEPVRGLTIDAVGGGWAWRLARALAPLREAGPPGRSGTLPTSAALLDLHDIDLTDPAAVTAAWAGAGRTTQAPVGVTEDGVASIDLRRDGPHALLGGTTGSGKSELLQTLVTSLAMVNRPDELCFVLVDYKGGAAFAGCAELPHVVGVVTDLDEQLAVRALSSLQAELTRRERLLADVGAADLDEYQQAPSHGSRPPLARLVLVIDEFRVLAQELPDFLVGLVRLAAVGRSLGVHLVLATQRPAGVVSADIQANVNLRIALRVRDRGDSDDVLDAPDAAFLPQHVPGRALARAGSGPLTAFQVARVGSWGTRPVRQQPRVWRVDDAAMAECAEPTGTALCEGADVLSVLAASAREATRRLGVSVPPSPWLPALPEEVDLDDVERAAGVVPAANGRGGMGDGSAAEGAGAAALGMADLPHEQRQAPLLWHPVRDGHLAVVGGRASGRTTTLRTLALGLAGSWPPEQLHLHLLDVGESLHDLAALPHVGTVLGHDRPALVARLLTRLAEQLAERQHAGSHLLPRSGSSVPSSASTAGPVVLLVDGWEAVVSALEGVDHGRAVDELLALVRDGASAGLRIVVTGGRDVLLGRLASLVSDRLVLRTGDPTDLLLAGLRADAVPTHQPPGRAVRTADGVQVQVALPRRGEEPALTLASQVGCARERWGEAPPPGVVRLRALPSTVSADSLLDAQAGAADGHRWALIGVGGDEAKPCGLNLDTDPVAVVSGPPGSGRTTALRTMASSLSAAGAAVITVCPRAGAALEGPWPCCPSDAPDRLSRLLRENPTACVLVDDVELLADGPVEPLLVQLARRRGPTALVVAGDSGALVHGFRGVGPAARAARTGLVLCPGSPGDGEVVGVRLQLPDERVPGRGVLVVRGSQVPVQVGR
jgi:DNA segregation ATPase FtsK/SpoIIIE, S-DNA-T family